jgi:hypothetical protein
LIRHTLDDLYLGLDDDIEYDSVSSSGPDVLAVIPGMFINSIEKKCDYACLLKSGLAYYSTVIKVAKFSRGEIKDSII